MRLDYCLLLVVSVVHVVVVFIVVVASLLLVVVVVVAGIVIFLPLFLSARELCKSILGCQLQFQPLFRFPASSFFARTFHPPHPPPCHGRGMCLVLSAISFIRIYT